MPKKLNNLLKITQRRTWDPLEASLTKVFPVCYSVLPSTTSKAPSESWCYTGGRKPVN